MHHWISLWFLWQKRPPPPGWGKIFLTLDLSISGNFEQLWFLWQKSPPSPGWGKFFDFRSIHFRQFQATLVFVAETPSQDEGNFSDFRSIHFRQFWATLVFVAEKPPPQDEGKFFDLRSIHFRQFQAPLVFVAEKPPPHFCLFIMDQARITQVEYPRSPYYKSILRFLLSEYLL